MTSPRIPLGRAHMLATSAIRDIRRSGLPTEFISLAGSLRRYLPDIGDVSLLAVTAADRHDDLLSGFAALPSVTTTESQTPSSVTITTSRGRVTLHVAAPDDAGAALVWHTGSRQHTAQLQDRARRFDLRLEDGRLLRNGGTAVPAPSEKDVYTMLDLPFIVPELRDDAGAIAAADRGELPHLVSDLHIRGDLHMHSTWSDGRDSIEQMVAGARQLGYEYVAITDHSERSWASRRLAAADVGRQREEIDAVRARVPGIQILHGIEVDIMHDGSLDFSDDVLSAFDIVLASLHDHGGHGGRQLTERYLAAIEHPLVNIITHPANRSPAHSPGYDVDFDRLFDAARAHGTAMEIDGAPGHLDMDGAIARRAVAAGVTVSIDSDCHRADALGRQMKFGIGTARRGWVEPQHVLNARSVDEVRAFIAAKREGR